MNNNLPPNWSLVKLGEVIAKIPTTEKKLKQKDYLSEGKYPVIDQGQNLIGGYTNERNLLIDCELPVIVFGDHTKVKKFINFKFVPGADGVKIIKPSKKYNEKLFYYFLHCIKIPNKGYARHFQFIEKAEIPLPPLPEQKKIVAKIEKLFSELDNGVEQLKKAKEQIRTYRQAVLQFAFEGKLTAYLNGVQVVAKAAEPKTEYKPKQKDDNLPEGWKWVKLGEVTYINPKIPFEKIKEDTKVTFLPMKRVEELTGKFDLIEEKNYTEVRKGFTPFINGDVIFAKITPCMENGKIAVMNNLKNKIGFGSTEFHVFRTNYELYNYYLFYFLIQDLFRSKAKHNMTGAVGQKRVPKRFLEESEIPLPPLSEQHQIVSEIEKRFSEADNLEKTIDKSLEKSEILRQSILKQAFEGKLI